jgi:endoglucanase Acf2
MEDWFTYTPGENEHYFALYPQWGALVGFGTSYYSEDFTDHHFHYGYFTYAAGLLAMYDEEFAAGYGEMATLVAKEYANYNRDDTRFPMFRTFDPWMGHSYAGGTGSGAGNNQESSSEAMQSWIGMYVLGTALGNKAMRDAGAFGYAIEAQACAEYWFDRDGTNFPDDWNHDISTVVWSNSLGYWTYFSGDPVWMHAIIWLPIAPGFYYLVEDYDYAEAEFWGMMADTGNQVIPDSWNSGLGNVVLGYWQLFDPDGAAAEFDRLWDSNSNVVHNTDTGGISYYYLHSNRMLGRVNWDAWTNLPTSMVYLNAESGERSVGAQNPWDQDVDVTVYEAGTAQATFTVPANTVVRHIY